MAVSQENTNLRLKTKAARFKEWIISLNCIKETELSETWFMARTENFLENRETHVPVTTDLSE